MKAAIIYIILGSILAIIRIFITGHYYVTNEKLVPDLVLIVTFWGSILLIGLGFAMYTFNKLNVKR